MPRLDQLLELLKADAADPFLRYAIAMEYAKGGEHEKALVAFNELIAQNADYVAAYFMAGRSCEQKDDPAEARNYYQRGIIAARRVGDEHAAGEMSSALMMLE